MRRLSPAVGIAWWRDDTSSFLPDFEVLRSLRPGLMTTRGQLIAISSPFGKRGELYKAHEKFYGKEARTLVARAPSIVMNNSLDPDWIAEQIALDPVGASSEYEATFRDDTSGFLRQEYVEAVTVKGRHELLPVANRRYHAFTDASGGSSDSFTLAIAHNEDDIAILDLLREVKPPFSHQNVVTEFAKVCKAYRCTEVFGDDYSGGMVKEMYSLAGITYRRPRIPHAKDTGAKATKSEIFLEILPIINSNKCELLDVFKQLCGLQRKVAAGGRETIEKGSGFHDDIANSACGSLVLAALQPKQMRYAAPILINEAPAGTDVLPSVVRDPGWAQNPPWRAASNINQAPRIGATQLANAARAHGGGQNRWKKSPSTPLRTSSKTRRWPKSLRPSATRPRA